MSVKLFTVEKDASGNLVPGVEVKTLTEGDPASLDQHLYTKDGTTHKFELKIEDGKAYMLVSTYEVLADVTEDVPMYNKVTLYKLVETVPPTGYKLPTPNEPYYFYIKGGKDYTKINGIEPVIYDSSSLGGNVYQNFIIDRVNAEDERYVEPGKVKVKKIWMSGSTEMEDTSQMPEITVKLVEYTPKSGWRWGPRCCSWIWTATHGTMRSRPARFCSRRRSKR